MFTLGWSSAEYFSEATFFNFRAYVPFIYLELINDASTRISGTVLTQCSATFEMSAMKICIPISLTTCTDFAIGLPADLLHTLPLADHTTILIIITLWSCGKQSPNFSPWHFHFPSRVLAEYIFSISTTFTGLQFLTLTVSIICIHLLHKGSFTQLIYVLNEVLLWAAV